MFQVPVENGEPLHLPYHSWEDWKGDTYCGPGELGDKLVPDVFPGGTIMTPV